MTFTFNGFLVFNDIGDTIVICLGLDCNTVTLCYDQQVTEIIGFSNFWATRARAGLTWDSNATWITPPQYGYFHGTPLAPSYVFGIPPGSPPDDHGALADWLRSWAASEDGKQHTVTIPSV